MNESQSGGCVSLAVVGLVRLRGGRGDGGVRLERESRFADVAQTQLRIVLETARDQPRSSCGVAAGSG